MNRTVMSLVISSLVISLRFGLQGCSLKLSVVLLSLLHRVISSHAVVLKFILSFDLPITLRTKTAFLSLSIDTSHLEESILIRVGRAWMPRSVHLVLPWLVLILHVAVLVRMSLIKRCVRYMRSTLEWRHRRMNIRSLVTVCMSMQFLSRWICWYLSRHGGLELCILRGVGRCVDHRILSLIWTWCDNLLVCCVILRVL
jgi:hypothetical protein